jgi:phosphinothricin acetyltransferase
MPVLVRPSQDADLAVCHAVYAHAVIHGTASWELEPPDLAEFARRRAVLLDGGFPWLVAEADGRVLGYAYAGPYRPRAAYRATVEDSVYVAPEACGRGIGTSLLTTLMAACAFQGFRQMVAVIGDGEGGSVASTRLHEKAGFSRIGVARAVGFKHGRWLDQVLMQKALGEGSSGPSPFA